MPSPLDHVILVLSNTPRTITDLLHNLSSDQLYANEGPDTWSPFDVVGHLIHGEKTDWIPRARIILSDKKDKTFGPFDRFAQFDNSKGKDIDQLLDEFSALREQNQIELEKMHVTEEMMTRTGIHPEFGVVTLGQLLNTWAMHDLSHIAQISRVLAKQFGEHAGPWNQYFPLRKD